MQNISEIKVISLIAAQKVQRVRMCKMNEFLSDGQFRRHQLILLPKQLHVHTIIGSLITHDGGNNFTQYTKYISVFD